MDEEERNQVDPTEVDYYALLNIPRDVCVIERDELDISLLTFYPTINRQLKKRLKIATRN